MPRKDYLFVGIQFVLFLVYLFPISIFTLTLPSTITYLGLLIFFLGILMGAAAILQLHSSLSPFPSPKLNGQLVKNGVFSLVRHPIYFSILCCVFGYGLFQYSAYKLLVGLSLFVLFHFKSKYEETLLQEKYSDYSAYQQKTGRLFPKFKL